MQPRHSTDTDLIAQLEQHLLIPSPAAPPHPSLAAAANLLAGEPARAARFWTHAGHQTTGPTVATHLAAAHTILHRDGWTQGAYVTGGVCAKATLQIAAEEGNGTEHTAYVARNCMNLLLRARGEYRDIIAWNDTPGRRREDLAELLTSAASFATHYGPR